MRSIGNGWRTSGSLWKAATLVLAVVLLAAGTALAGGPDAPSTPGSLCNTPAAAGCSGATSLAVYNPTHYALPLGASVTGKIVGATDVTGSATNVLIKRTDGSGNPVVDTVAGSVSGGVITFSYTAPRAGNVCGTGIVAYKTSGNNSNNDVVDDGVQNGSGTSAAGYAFVDASGNTLPCGPTAITLSSFGASPTAGGLPWAAAGLAGLVAGVSGAALWRRRRTGN